MPLLSTHLAQKLNSDSGERKNLKKYHFFTGMGTKIEYSINLLASSVDSNNFIVGGVDVWEHYQHKGVTNNHFSLGINKLQDPPMDRMLDRNNIESIKKTMQMHEDIFKQQVSYPCCSIYFLILTVQNSGCHSICGRNVTHTA